MHSSSRPSPHSKSQVHALREKLTNAIYSGNRRRLSDNVTSTLIVFNSTKELIDNYRYRFVEAVYYLAALKPPSE